MTAAPVLGAPLRRGLSASFWFEWLPANAEAARLQLERKYQPVDWRRLRDVGFDHIRLPLQPGVLSPRFMHGDASFDPTRLALVQAAVASQLEAGLSVVLDAHPASATKDRLAKDDVLAQTLAAWWRNLAGQFANTPTDRVFFELLNEPEESLSTPRVYRSLTDRLIAAARAAAPRHTLVVGGPNWSVPEGLYDGVREPFDDPNILYTFHFYQPKEFTHQGLVNAGDFYARLRDLPWGGAKGDVGAGRIDASDHRVQAFMRRYDARDNGKESLRPWFQRVRAWCDRVGREAWLGEFGVYRRVAPEESRLAWLRAVRELAEEYRFGWAMWEAKGGFGLYRSDASDGEPIDQRTLAALGLA